jgi:iron complex outermembrane receptor protein
LNESYTFSDFRFSDYIVTNVDLSGKRLAGVPKQNLVSAIELYLPLSSSFYLQYSNVGSIPLNDSNSASASKYKLLQAKLSFQRKIRSLNVQFFAGGDNLLNQKYSLGNDLNAFGSRFFNAAATRNFYGGLKASL